MDPLNSGDDPDGNPSSFTNQETPPFPPPIEDSRSQVDNSPAHDDGTTFIPTIVADPKRLPALAYAQLQRFQEYGDLQGLTSAIINFRAVLDFFPEKHPSALTALRQLANCFRLRFEAHGKLQDLDQAINYYNNVTQQLPANHQLQASNRMHLGDLLVTRFHRERSPEDLDNAIACYQHYLSLRNGEDPDRVFSLDKLADSLLTRFSRGEDPQDLQDAVDCYAEAVYLLPEGHPDHCKFLRKFEHAEALLIHFENPPGPRHEFDPPDNIELGRPQQLSGFSAYTKERPLDLGKRAVRTRDDQDDISVEPKNHDTNVHMPAGWCRRGLSLVGARSKHLLDQALTHVNPVDSLRGRNLIAFHDALCHIFSGLLPKVQSNHFSCYSTTIHTTSHWSSTKFHQKVDISEAYR
ncbi:hypothetical protein FRC03_010625 [Tulasnella sp. 419]|nr:hypothetical protein FRC03_010625 [Tulasnella sp. 419]